MKQCQHTVTNENNKGTKNFPLLAIEPQRYSGVKI